MSLRELLIEVSERLVSLGHSVEWDLVGERLAHGHCCGCGKMIVVEVGQRFRAVKGCLTIHACAGQSQIS